MNFNNDYGLLDLKYLTSYFNEILGSKFKVKLNSSPYPDRHGNVVTTLQAQRTPFAISNVKSETLTVNINFRLREEDKQEVLASINKILGCQTFELDTYKEDEQGNAVLDKKFKLASYLDLQMPINDPQIDSGEIMVDYQVNGTILVTDSDSGAVISNYVLTELSDKPFDNSDVKAENMLSIISCRVALSKSVEPYNSTGSHKMNAVAKVQSCSYTINALYLDRKIDNELIKNIELIDDSFDCNKFYYLRRTYPNGVISTKKCLLVEGNITEQAGAYLQYEIALQEVL